MKYRIPTIALTAALVVACSENQRDPTEMLTPDLSAASGCYTVKFNQVGGPTSVPWIFEGQITGDLEGSATWEFDPTVPPRVTGVTNTLSGVMHWDITGGIVPELGQFDTEFQHRNHVIDTRNSPATVYENLGTHRALNGVEIANLHYKGTFVAHHGDWDYHGVICP